MLVMVIIMTVSYIMPCVSGFFNFHSDILLIYLILLHLINPAAIKF
jgi:hypothetical protein